MKRHMLAGIADQIDRVFMNNSSFEAERRVDALYASVGQTRTSTIEGRQERTVRIPIQVRT